MRDLDWLKDVLQTLGAEPADGREAASSSRVAAVPEEMAAEFLALLMQSGQEPDQESSVSEREMRDAYAAAGSPYGADETGWQRWYRELMTRLASRKDDQEPYASAVVS